MTTNFDKLHNMSKDELAAWIDQYGMFDGSPWMDYFDQKYCSNCEAIMCRYENEKRKGEFPVSWCELNGHCKYFPDMQENPTNIDIIKLWFDREVEV